RLESEDESVEKYFNLSFYSFLFLTQALVERRLMDGVEIDIISSNMQDVTGAEDLCPEKAVALGPCRVIPQEYPNVTCRSIDMEVPELGSHPESRLIDQILAEITTKSPDAVIAYRGHHRWRRVFDPIRLEAKGEGPSRIREEGVYLITGGLGGI